MEEFMETDLFLFILAAVVGLIILALIIILAFCIRSIYKNRSKTPIYTTQTTRFNKVSSDYGSAPSENLNVPGDKDLRSHKEKSFLESYDPKVHTKKPINTLNSRDNSNRNILE